MNVFKFIITFRRYSISCKSIQNYIIYDGMNINSLLILWMYLANIYLQNILKINIYLYRMIELISWNYLSDIKSYIVEIKRTEIEELRIGWKSVETNHFRFRAKRKMYLVIKWCVFGFKEKRWINWIYTSTFLFGCQL